MRVTDKINKYIDEGLTKKNKEEKPREYLGASILGYPCGRKIQYMWKNTTRDAVRELSGRVLRIFKMGDKYEELAIEWLEQAGFKLETRDKNGKQLGFTAVDNSVKGHIDGKIVDGPKDISYPRLWECKSMNVKKFSYFQTMGVENSHPHYYSQVQFYMHMLDLKDNPAILTGVNKENGDMHHQEIEYNKSHCEELISKAKEIVEKTNNKELMPRPFDNREGFECRYCDWQDRCWRTNE